MLPVLMFPQFDPVLVRLGPLSIRWYALAYIVGILLGWRYARTLVRRPPIFMDVPALDDFVFAVTLGIVLGGRLGYVLFYKPGVYLAHPLDILSVWQGGMSFHGGMLGVVVAIIVFARQRRLALWSLADVMACVTPIGLFLGRLANFVNGELWGRPSDAPWAMIFPGAGPEPRHPSQLYQASLEGVLLFLILFALERQGWRHRPGFLTGAFLVGYGALRSLGELFRQPDAFLGFLWRGLTMGQLLSAPMIAIGLVIMARAARRRSVQPTPDRVAV